MRITATVPALAIAAAAVLVATLAGSGFGAGAAVVGAAGTVLVLISGAPDRAAAIGTAALAVACSSIATPTVGLDLGRGLAIAGPPIALTAAAVSIGSRPRLGAVLVVVGGIIAGPARALVDDPFLDAACLSCRHNALAVLPDRAAVAATATVGAALLASGAVVLIRRSTAPVLASAVAACALALLPGIAPLGPTVGIAALGLALLSATAQLLALTTARRRLAELGRGTGAIGGATDLLRRATGDPALSVDYPPADSTGLPVVVGRSTIAAIRSSSPRLRNLLDPPDPALVIALLDERLDLALQARVEELRESRGRVVRRADEERRRLERDLHDGAQQHVLALGFDLRAAIVRETTPARVAVLEACLAETSLALDDLREISHGVYPALLAIAGLGPALRALASRTPVGLEVGDLPGRLPQSVERVAYMLVSELAHASGGPVAVDGAAVDGVLRVTVAGAAAGPGDLLRERIAAQSGTIEEAEGRWRMTVPCG